MRHTAIRNLYANAVTIDDGAGVFDANGNLIAIDEDAVSAEIERMKVEYAKKDYQRNRAKEYPDFRDYLDGVVKGDQAQIDAYITACQAVKAKYPKPE